MITLPPDLVATKYSGYFWDLKQQVLYSLKLSGVLREMTITKPSHFNHNVCGYRVSVGGCNRYLLIDDLKKLTMIDSVIPIQKRKVNDV